MKVKDIERVFLDYFSDGSVVLMFPEGKLENGKYVFDDYVNVYNGLAENIPIKYANCTVETISVLQSDLVIGIRNFGLPSKRRK